MTTPDTAEARRLAAALRHEIKSPPVADQERAGVLLDELIAEVERLRALVAEPFWYAVVSERAPVINATYRREDVALERLAKIQEERPDITDAEVVPLYRAAPAQQADEARDAARYRSLRGTLGTRSSTYAPRITDPSNEWLTYTPEGLDKVCDEMAATKEPT